MLNQNQRREDKFHFDWTINVGTVTSLVFLIITLISYGSRTINYLRGIDNKVTIMWADFALRNPSAALKLNVPEE